LFVEFSTNPQVFLGLFTGIEEIYAFVWRDVSAGMRVTSFTISSIITGGGRPPRP